MRASLRRPVDRLLRISQRDPLAMQPEKHRLGLAYGLLVGLTFCLIVWGVDAYYLTRAHAVLSCAKLVVGVTLTLPLFTLVGWLSARWDKPWIAALLWLATSLWASLLTAWLLLDGFYFVLQTLAPEWASRVNYPFGLTLLDGLALSFLPTLTVVIAGLVGMALLDSAAKFSGLRRWLQLSVFIPLVILGALALDGMTNIYLRRPIVAVDELIRAAQSVPANPADNEQTLLHRLDARRPFLHKSYRMTVAGFDPEITVVTVVVDFGDLFLYCPVFSGNPGLCRLTGPGG